MLALQVKDEAFYNEAINSELFSDRATLVDDYSKWVQDHHEAVSVWYDSSACAFFSVCFGKLVALDILAAGRPPCLPINASQQLFSGIFGVLSCQCDGSYIAP